MEIQLKAIIVIHSGWALVASRDEEFARMDSSGELAHSPVYFNALLAELKQKHPNATPARPMP